jgi:SAM-dependent methyltransferase
MTGDSFRRDSCRLCGSADLSLVLGLTPTPPANAFVPETELGAEQAVYPLDVYFCNDCAHVQLLDVVDPKVLFENYVYVSGTSPVFVKHFDDYAAAVVERYQPVAAGGLVVDIGSNDGTLLGAFQRRGFSVLGVDPARDIAADATARGIETMADFFTSGLARAIRQDRGAASVVTANNVFAHADNLADIADGVASLLAPDGVFVFEVSYLLDVYEKTLFDTIYHEHLAYHSIKPLVPFFRRHGLKLASATRVDSHGGSLRGIAALADSTVAEDGSVAELIAAETAAGLDRAETLIGFASDIDAVGDELRQVLNSLKSAGKSVAAFGASAKATTLMYHFGIGPDIIDFIVDDSPLKQGLYSPGMHIPVVPSDVLYARRPDAVVILAWNFVGPIIKNHAAYRDAGGRFIVPLPTVEIY